MQSRDYVDYLGPKLCLVERNKTFNEMKVVHVLQLRCMHLALVHVHWHRSLSIHERPAADLY
jgi:hypothetical protein